jgi:hypothetical protein
MASRRREFRCLQKNQRPIRSSFRMGRLFSWHRLQPVCIPGRIAINSRQAEVYPTRIYVANLSRANIGKRRLRVRADSFGGAATFSGALGAGASSGAICGARTGKPNKLSGEICPDEESAGMRPSDASRLRATRSATPNFANKEETWNFTVRSATFSFEAISLFERL